MTVLANVARLIDDMENVGELFREARGERTQAEFGWEMKTTTVYLSRIENGLAQPSLTMIKRLRDVLEER